MQFVQDDKFVLKQDIHIGALLHWEHTAPLGTKPGLHNAQVFWPFGHDMQLELVQVQVQVLFIGVLRE